MEAILHTIAKWANAQTEKKIICISGHGAAGKTTFARNLINVLAPCDINYINTDPYIINSEIRKKTIIDYTYDGEPHRYKMTACHPAAHHLPSLERDIRMIREGLELYTIDTHYAPRTLLLPNNKLTIVEGMSAAFIDQNLFDLTIYFYTDDETEFLRRSKRDIMERGMELQYLHHSHNERRIQYEVFMHPYSEKFDIVIQSSQDISYIVKNDWNKK